MLRNRARQLRAKIPYGRLRKADLQRVLAAITLQRRWREILKRRARQKPNNELDAFSMEKIPKHSLSFMHIEGENAIWQFEVDSLCRYFLTSGNFCNPFSRTPFNIVELRRLDKLSGYAFAEQSKAITHERKMEQEAKHTFSFLRDEAARTLDILWQPIPPLERNFVRVMDHLMYTCEFLVPTFVDLVTSMRELDENVTRDFVKHVLELLWDVVTSTGTTFTLWQRNSATTASNLIGDYYRTFHGTGL